MEFGANQADALSVTDASTDFLVFVSTTGQEKITLGVDIVPDADGTLDIGSTTTRLAGVHADLHEGDKHVGTYEANSSNTVAITANSVVAMVSGDNDGVAMADAASHAFFLGFANAAISGAASGVIVREGKVTVRKVSAETWSYGDKVFVASSSDGNSAGELTKTAPATASEYKIPVGYAISGAGASASGVIQIVREPVDQNPA